MPSSKPAKCEKLKALITFAKGLSDRLQADAQNLTIHKELQSHIACLPLPTSALASCKKAGTDPLGTALWNLSTRLYRQESACDKDILCSLRTFSLLLLDTEQQVAGNATQNGVRVLKVALKAAKYCLDNNQLDLCSKNLERAAHYVQDLENVGVDDHTTDADIRDKLRIKYLGLRTALAWKQSRLDIAEHMFSKLEPFISGRLEPSTAESFADLLYEMGRDLFGKRQFPEALKWIQRSHDILTAQNLDQLSNDAGELRLGIMQSLVKALNQQPTAENIRKAWGIISLLEADYGDKTVVCLLKLELLASENPLNVLSYGDVILRIIPSVVLTEAMFKTLMHHIHVLHSTKEENGVNTACKILDNLISSRLLDTDNAPCLEKACITRLWLCSNLPETEQLTKSLAALFNTVSNNCRRAFSANAIHAAQTLLWKRVETSFSQQQYESAQTWCRLSLHSLFENAGNLNRAKIGRKMMMCALSLQDVNSAREAYFAMSEESKSAATTQYLMYKVALRENNVELASQCLDKVCRQSKKDGTLLYACVLEAQQAGDKRQATVALQKVVEKYNYNTPEGVHLPALLRCTTRLLVGELEAEGRLDHEVANEIAKLFEGAAHKAQESRKQKDKPPTKDFSRSELEWFSKNTYNLALKHCAALLPDVLVRMLLACMQFIDLLNTEPEQAEPGLPLRKIYCLYLTTTAYLTLARSEDQIQNCLNYYLAVQKYGKEFRDLAVAEINAPTAVCSPVRDDLVSKHTQILTYELEAALKLSKWSSIEPLLQEAFIFDTTKHLDTLADLVILIHYTTSSNLSHSQSSTALPALHASILATLQKIINLTWRHSGADIIKLARWIRCLFQLSLHIDDTVSLQCMDQTSNIATKLRDQGAAEAYPLDELEWLATTGFNRAVDAYCAYDNAACRTWAEKALDLARVAGGEGKGTLYELLLGKYSGLTWEKAD